MLRPWPSGAVRVLCRVNHPVLACPSVYAARFPSTRRLQSTASTDRVPLRKQLKQEAKALKAQKKLRKESEEASRQEWELTVGVEIHAQLNTEAKLFSRKSTPSASRPWLCNSPFTPGAGAPTSTNETPNSNVALFDLAFPGSQPVRIEHLHGNRIESSSRHRNSKPPPSSQPFAQPSP